MVDEIQAKLTELRAEWDDGQRMLRECDQRRAEIQGQLLRVNGAITALEGLLPKEAT